MTSTEREKCEMCGNNIIDDCCMDCGHENFTSECACDTCVMIDGEEESGDEPE